MGLVLSRKVDQSIIVMCHGERIRITVVGLRDNKVRLLVQAPLEFSVDREEVYEAKQKELEGDRGE